MSERPPNGSDVPPTRVRPSSVVVRYRKVRVDVTRGPDAGATAEIVDKVLRIGTGPDNDLVMADDSVSRRHCEMEAVAEGIRVRDSGSTNGTFCGGLRIYDSVVPADCRLRIGDTELTLVPLAETVERERVTAENFGDVLGRSARMQLLFAALERIAASDVTVLIEGETGTGKDLLAESIHGASARKDQPFVVFDCGAVSPALVESELFGHERGAFTGAVQPHAGVFEQADGGTLFLDELGELPKELQPKLLRALESRQVRRVGGAKVLSFDVRVIAATNKNLRAEVAKGSFREDLYFRISATHVVAPPLRDRMEDLPLLVGHFLSMERPPRSTADVPEHVWELFRAHRWPGNVRELRNAVQRLLLTPEYALHEWPSAGQPQSSPIAAEPPGLLPFRVARREANDDFERHYVSSAMARAGGNVTRAARLADLSRQMIQKLLRKHGLRRQME